MFTIWHRHIDHTALQLFQESVWDEESSIASFYCNVLLYNFNFYIFNKFPVFAS